MQTKLDNCASSDSVQSLIATGSEPGSLCIINYFTTGQIINIGTHRAVTIWDILKVDHKEALPSFLKMHGKLMTRREKFLVCCSDFASFSWQTVCSSFYYSLLSPVLVLDVSALLVQSSKSQRALSLSLSRLALSFCLLCLWHNPGAYNCNPYTHGDGADSFRKFGRNFFGLKKTKLCV